jgi:ParB family chromosome partitioning protein
MKDEPTARDDDNPQPSAFRRIPLRLIDQHADQPRRSMDDAALQELTRSVKEYGVLQPIRVRPREAGRYEVIAGHRRVVASRLAGLDDVPAMVVVTGEERAMIEALVENVQREDLNPIDRGEALRRLRVNLGTRSWEEVGRIIGISRRHVYHLLNVTKLPEPICEALRSRTITERHGRALLRLRRNPGLQMRLWRRILEEGLSGEDAFQLAGELMADSQPNLATRRSAGAAPTALHEATTSLVRLLPNASTSEIRSLRGPLENLHRQLEEVLTDAFHDDEHVTTIGCLREQRAGRCS